MQAAPGGFGGGLIATSGIDHDIKLWRPQGDFKPSALFRSATEQEQIFVGNYAQGIQDAEEIASFRGDHVAIDMASLQQRLLHSYNQSHGDADVVECPIA